MKVTFLGTGTSMGVPVAGGFGSDRIGPDPRNNRWRSSAWVRTGECSVVIDTGPEFRLQTLRSGIRRIDLVLITHEHMDHIAGLDDLRPFCYKQQQSIPLYTTEDCIQAIRTRFDYMFGPEKYPGAASLDLQLIEEEIQFRDLSITPLPVIHGSVDVLGYRLNDFSYMTDVKAVPDQTKALIRGSKVMVLSGLRWAPEHPTHLTIPEAADIADELEIPKTYLIHMNGHVDHEEVNAKLPDHVELAYDELEIEL